MCSVQFLAERTVPVPVLVSVPGNPDPPTLAFLKNARENPEKSKGFSLCGTPKILGKERENAQKSKGNRKT